MLQRVAAFDAGERVFRVALNPERWRVISRIRAEVGDETELAEALSFLGDPAELNPSTLGDLLALPFIRRPFPKDRRFSNGDFGVLYTARTPDTAGREYAYWAPRNFAPPSGNPMRVRLHLISCWFQGRAKDVRQFADEYPWLVSNDYSECQKLGAAARAEGLAGIIAPSARDRPDGATVPIFLLDAASQPKADGDVIFIVSATEPTIFEIIRGNPLDC